MTFEQEVALLPQWVQIWLNIFLFGSLACMVVMLFNAATRIPAIISAILLAASAFSTVWLYDQVGFVRLLGLGHVVFLTPAVIYLVMKLRTRKPPTIYAAAGWLLVALFTISLIFDYFDVIRWLLGERGNMV